MPRSPRRPTAIPFAPSQAWIDEFDRQCTPKLYEESHRFATYRARAIQRAGGSADEHYVESLVQDILSDTATGKVTWNSDVKTLQEHVWDVIRTRTNHARRRTERYQHEAIEISDPDAAGELLGEVEIALAAHERAVDQETAPEIDDARREKLDWLRAQCAADPAALQVIDALQAGATTGAQIRQLTGLSAHEYKMARRRIRRHMRTMYPGIRSQRRRLKKGA